MIVEGERLDGLMGDRKRKPAYVDKVTIGEYRDDEFEELSTGPTFIVKVTLDVDTMDHCVAIRQAIVETVDRLNEELGR